MMSKSDDQITVVHLAVEINTPQRDPTTRAVEALIEEASAFSNVVVAYRRTVRPVDLRETSCADRPYRLYDFPFFGLPFGVGLLGAMRVAARRTIALLDREKIKPDIVHAHKLTFEGLAGYYVARHYNVPLFISVRGEVETKVFRFKPHLRKLFRDICLHASRIYFVSAWFSEEFHRFIPHQPGKERFLPNIVRNVSSEIKITPASQTFVSVMNLDTWKRKGLRWLLEGFADACSADPELRLEIIGGGTDRAKKTALKLIRKTGLQSKVKLLGHLENKEALERLRGYCGLLLPSLNETFGMVYVEALFAGIPILFTKGTAIDGYLQGLNIVRTVPPRDPRAISDAILDMSESADLLRRNIKNAAPELYAIFNKEGIARRYRQALRSATTA